MWQYALKILLTAAVAVAAAEIAKRSTLWGAVLVSLPLTSLFAIIWLYLDTGSTTRVGELSQGIFWLVLPSLVLFPLLPALLRSNLGCWTSLGTSCVAMAVAYFAMAWVLARFGVRA